MLVFSYEEMDFHIGQYLKSGKRVIDFLEFYYQNREIFPISDGYKEIAWEEVNEMNITEQVKLLEEIVHDESHHQNLPYADVIGYLQDMLAMVLRIRDYPKRYGELA